MSNDSSFSTTGTPHSSDSLDSNVKYTNLNFVDNSESSSQVKDAKLEYQKFQNSIEPSKILPNNSSLPGMENSKAKNELFLKEKSLLEMGFKANEGGNWENIEQPPKENLYKLLKNMINNHIKPNVQIRIGSVYFNCHMMVLQCYSDLFMEFNNELLIQLPEEKVTPGAFMMVYDWMLAEKPLVQREGILELFNAANFLRIKELINQCWFCLDDDVCFREDTAFLLYLEARNYGLESLEQLMLMRICKFFLTLVASKEFLSLNAKEICTMLNLNTIGVNSEIEIFMSVVRWVNDNWEQRKEHLLDVIKCVRFSLMPPWYLVSLNKNTNCPEIDRIVNNSEVKKMITDGISFTTTQHYYRENREELLQFLERYQMTLPMQRQWVYDKECSYHHRLDCSNMQNVTYKSFLEYLEMIQTIGKDHWRSLEMAKGNDQSLKCCTRSDCSKSADPNLGTLFIKKSRDQGIQCENCSKSPRIRGYIKTSLTNNPRRHTKYVPSTAEAAIYSINNDNTTETEATVDFKYPKESQQQQPENILYDNNHQQTDVKEQHIINCHTVHHTTKTTPITTTKTQSSDNHEENHVESKQDQQQNEQKYLQQQQHQLQQQQQYNNATATTTANCTVIYKRDGGDILADVSSGDSNIGEGLYPNHQLKRNQQQQQQCIIANNHHDDDAELMKNNIGVVAKKALDCNDNEDLLKTGTTKPNTITAIVDFKSISNHKILVFGGIDPYCLHCQHVQQHHQQKQQQQQQLLQKYQQRKRVLSIDTIMNTHHQRRPHPPRLHTHSETHTNTNALANNKFKHFGDHVLLYDIHGEMVWRHLSHLPFGSRHHHAVVVCNGLIYVIGGTRTAFGCTKKSVGISGGHIYQVSLNLENLHPTSVDEIIKIPDRECTTTISCQDFSVFEKSVWCFDPQTLKWTPESNLPESRRDFAVIAIDQQKCVRCKGIKNKKEKIHDSGFYVIGGEGVKGTALPTVWFYNVKRKVWIKKPSLNMGRYGLAAAMVNNEIWVAGGIINDNSAGICGNNNDNGETTKSTTAHVITDTVEIYNLKCSHEILASNDVVEGFTKGNGNGNHDDGMIGNYNVAIPLKNEPAGGDDNMGGIPNNGCNCKVGQWIVSKLHLRIPRVYGKFCKMPNGHLYLVGGIGSNGKGVLTSLADIDKYNVNQNKWEHFGDLNWARHGHDVGRLNDHCFVVIGGVSTIEKCTLNKVEAFCTTTRKCLKDIPDLPWPVSGCAVVALN